MLGTDRLGVLKRTLDLFQAGYMTTMETLVWALVLLAYHPEVQEKVYAGHKLIIKKDIYQ